MSSLLRATVEDTVIAVIEDLIQDWGLEIDGGVGTSTQLVANLEFASVDIIQLCVALEEATAASSASRPCSCATAATSAT